MVLRRDQRLYINREDRMFCVRFLSLCALSLSPLSLTFSPVDGWEVNGGDA